MAVKSIVVSDISGEDIEENKHARVIIKHPDYSAALEIDASTDETDQLKASTLRLVTLTIHAPNAPVREVTMETKALDAIFKEVDWDTVLRGARKSAEQPARARRASSASTASKGDKLDYTAMENIGLIHRGRVTEEEAKLVKANMAKANENRARAGQPKIGDDPKDAQRYGL